MHWYGYRQTPERLVGWFGLNDTLRQRKILVGISNIIYSEQSLYDTEKVKHVPDFRTCETYVLFFHCTERHN